MDVKRMATLFAYKIEPNPAGGFTARASDLSVSPLEAPTRQELQQKIQQNILKSLSAEFPALKLCDGKHEMSFHVEHRPGGGFSIHSADPNAPVVHTADPHDFESKFLEKFLNLAGKHLMPELSKALAAQVGSANIKVVVNGKTSFRVNSSPQGIAFGPKTPSIAQSAPPQTPKFVDPSGYALNGSIANTPITPESTSTWKLFGVMLLLAVVGGLVYFFFQYR